MIMDHPSHRVKLFNALWRMANNVDGSRTLRRRDELQLLGASIIFVLGVGIVAWDYAQQFPRPLNYILFWTGLGLCLIGTLVVGLRRSTQVSEQLLALAAFGATLWLPYFLRSPARLIFTDELFHYQTVQLIIESGHTNVPITRYQIPGEFPGLEFATLGLMATSNLSLDPAARIVTLLIHIVIPLLAYTVALGLGLGRHMSFIAALVYITNTSYYFFHSVFSYESLGIVLVLSVWTLFARHRNGRIPFRNLPLFVLLLFAATATHHISSYMLAFAITVTWCVQIVLRRGRGDVLWLIAALSYVLPGAWLKFRSLHAAQYLGASITTRLQTILRTIFDAEQRAPRRLFTASSLPAIERLIDFAYPPLLLVLALSGLYLVARRGGWKRASVMLLALGVFGPLIWIMTTPIVLTPSGSLAYRTWPLLFVGMCVYSAFAIVFLASWLGATAKPVWMLVVTTILGMLFTGGISIGDNQAGRFSSARPAAAAGPGTITADVVSAARWLERTAGRYHLLVADNSASVAFAIFGFQRAMGWGNWTPFIAESPRKVVQFMQDTGTEYIVTDQRITQLPPRYRYYFGAAELYGLEKQGYSLDKAFPPELLQKFDQIDVLSRIYDNGNIQIYHNETGTDR